MKTKFQKSIKENRKHLKKLGYPASTINSWEYGIRYPRLETAMKLQAILGIALDEIPYFQTYRKGTP
uniref:Putative DNA binding, helix-turn-helix domain containing protein n=1 Tax=viral metagenome TaxID=1070528 RepID=A0A6M3LNK8_9ZZZZ